MPLHFKDLTPYCKHLPDYDSHKVYGLVDDAGKPIIATFVHRLGKGEVSIDGVNIRSLGGMRFPSTKKLLYLSDQRAYTDGLRLSRAMTDKSAALGLPIGGAKTVIFSHNIKQALADESVLFDILHAFGEEILPRIGSYLTAEDVGTKQHHMEYLSKYAPKGTVTGFTHDVSEVTARGVVIAIDATIKSVTWPRMPTESEMLTHAIKGVGAVGEHILNKLWKKGVRDLYVADTWPGRAEHVIGDRSEIKIVSSDRIHALDDVDVLIPCAMGGSLNKKTVEKITATVVVGCENNQLQTPQDGVRLHQRGNQYAPDYVANSGGIIGVWCKAVIGKPINDMLPMIDTILTEIFEKSKESGMAPSTIADDMIAERIAQLELP